MGKHIHDAHSVRETPHRWATPVLIAMACALAWSAALLCLAVSRSRAPCDSNDVPWFVSRNTVMRSGGYDADATFCNIERRALTAAQFATQYMGRRPVVITNGVDNSHFASQVAREVLRPHWGNLSVVLSSANSYSYAKRVVPLEAYLNQLGEQSLDQSGDQTFYLFGDNIGDDWDALLSSYRRPIWEGGADGALSFGVAGRYTGVPFHTHGPVFADLLHGRKRWFLYPPGGHETVTFDPDASQWQWLHTVYSNLTAARAPLECTCRVGETLYIPSMWWHATLNLDPYTVFMSVFTTEPPVGEENPLGGLSLA